jgi:hypothetical protein
VQGCPLGQAVRAGNCSSTPMRGGQFPHHRCLQSLCGIVQESGRHLLTWRMACSSCQQEAIWAALPSYPVVRKCCHHCSVQCHQLEITETIWDGGRHRFENKNTPES